ncbi:MAG: hypothetical protein IPL93_05810 [Actinomycetales bacterium]|nr:hypothetical protein [Actinomycetales bacterium]
MRRSAPDAARAQRAELEFMHPRTGRRHRCRRPGVVTEVIERAKRDTGLGEDLQIVTSEHDILDGIALSLAGL